MATYADLLTRLKNKEDKDLRKQAQKKLQGEGVNKKIGSGPFKEEVYKQSKALLFELAKELVVDKKMKDKRKEIIEEYKRKLFNYLKLKGELYMNGFCGVNIQIIILQTLLGQGSDEFAVKATGFTIEGACILLQVIGTKFHKRFSQISKNGEKEHDKKQTKGINTGYKEIIKTLKNLKNGEFLNTRIGDLIEETLNQKNEELSTSNQKKESKADIEEKKESSQKSVSKASKECPSQSLAKKEKSVAFKYENMDSAFLFLSSSIDQSEIQQLEANTSLNLSYISDGELNSLFKAVNGNLAECPNDIEVALAFFWNTIHVSNHDFPRFIGLFGGLLYSLFVDKKIADFHKFMAGVDYKAVQEDQGIDSFDVYFKVFATFLYVIQQELGDKKLTHCYDDFKIKEACLKLKSFPHSKEIFKELADEGIPEKIITLIDVKS
ncbi:unnamed protein product [Moneuplotes crassus]|uniref:Uncharacterized protein n=1 Tax=Euplotes crassus TaxID=5936 RepID=A0AAD1U509_EUPCR|nr:unnamed protein product [Moneuplotes crassus]